MNATDVVGYAHPDGFVLCPDCVEGCMETEGQCIKPEGLAPIFAGSEWDRTPTCDHCNEPLEGLAIIGEEI